MEEQTIDLFNLGEVPVTLTYLIPGVAPMTFYMRPLLTREEQELRQTFFAQTDEQQRAGLAAHNVEMLARLSTRVPGGIPGLPEGAVIQERQRVAEAIKTFFGDGNPMKEKVAADALTRYYRITQPAEFFR